MHFKSYKCSLTELLGHRYPCSLTDEWYQKIPKTTGLRERTKNVVMWKYLLITFLSLRVLIMSLLIKPINSLVNRFSLEYMKGGE